MGKPLTEYCPRSLQFFFGKARAEMAIAGNFRLTGDPSAIHIDAQVELIELSVSFSSCSILLDESGCNETVYALFVDRHASWFGFAGCFHINAGNGD